uniref:Uncharacterized protein n=1 Tax=Anguilla anguilla TaxID=7936 RepID=A0A0E9RP28_ANGAN
MPQQKRQTFYSGTSLAWSWLVPKCLHFLNPSVYKRLLISGTETPSSETRAT